MTETIDLLVTNARQVCVVPAQQGGPQHDSAPGPQRGEALGTLGVVGEGGVAAHEGRIVAVGPAAELESAYDAIETLDAAGGVVVPGFVDPHTHLVWAGDRAGEFEMRVAGATYMQIMTAGGGINRTVRDVRAASGDVLVEETYPRLDRMMALGSTTVEIKTGYGLSTEDELKLLDAIYRLGALHAADVPATFLGAHAVPPEYEGRTDDYVDLVAGEMIPAAADFAREQGQPVPFCDVFCEVGVFDVAQSRRVLAAGREAGMPLKIHADEFEGLGGTKLAVEMGAVSADHLVKTPEADIRALGEGDTVAVGLPCTPFGLGHSEYTPARAILDAGGALAIATDCNPGTAWCESMQMAMALACRYMGLTPAQALAAGTINAAYAVGMGDRVGSLEPGKQADLLILDAPDYRHLGYRFGSNLVRTVVKAGRVWMP
jgi:imidazolonepropionase